MKNINYKFLTFCFLLLLACTFLLTGCTEKIEEEEVLGTSDTPSAEFIQCLADSGMIIYGSATCPACRDLVEDFGGYDAVEPLYVECNDFGDRCSEEMQTNYVPEIQINGEVFEGQRTFEDFAQATGCQY